MRKVLTSLLAAASVASSSSLMWEDDRTPVFSSGSPTNTYSENSFRSAVSVFPESPPFSQETYRALFMEHKPSSRPVRTIEDASRLTDPYCSQLVTILLALPSPEGRYAAGNGLLLSENGLLLTPYHVVDSIVTSGARGYVLLYSPKGHPFFEKIDVAAIWPSCDLALAKTSTDHLPPVHPITLSTRIPTDRLPVIGAYLLYPQRKTVHSVTPLPSPSEHRSLLIPGIYLSRSLTNSTTMLSVYGSPHVLRSIGAVGFPSSHASSPTHLHYSDPFLPKIQTRQGILEHLVPVILQAIPGNSGTPIFDQDGALMGMISTGDPTYPYEGGMASALIMNLFLKEYQKRALEKLEK